MKEVTDPALLEALEGKGSSKAVTDPAVLAQLEGPSVNPVARTVKSIPGSAGKFVGDLAEAALSPVQTVGGLMDLAAGGVQKAVYGVLPDSVKPTEQNAFYSPRAEQVADAVGGLYKGRYGSLRNLGNTIMDDPVGFAADASGVIGLGAMALRAGGLANAAKTASQVSKYTDPLYLAGKSATSIAKPIYKGVVGQTTGAGARVIDEALKGSPEFQQAMNSIGNQLNGGKATSEAEIVEKSKDALESIRVARGDAYRDKLQNLQGKSQQIDITDVKQLADDQLKRYNVKKAGNDLDFSRSTASGKSAAEISEVYGLVQEWGSQAGDLTPAMLDVLKRRLDDFYAEGRTSRAMVTTLKKAVHDKIVKAVPEYAEMTKDYAKATEVIKEMERAVGLGDKTAADTAIRKLSMALREDKNFRADLLKTLEAASGENVTGAVAGAVMRPLATRGLGAVAAGGIGITGLLTASPTLAALIPLASPRLVGELSVLLGKTGKLAPYGRGAGITAYQSGRLPLEE